VSTGALLATHAFLGTPADDATLEEIFTRIRASDIYVNKGMLGLLWGRNAIYDTSPLQALLDKHITAEVLQRVAAGYDKGRRLYVGTTNLDYNQTWVWSLGLIAKEGTQEALELYKKVLRASAAPPIAFPRSKLKDICLPMEVFAKIWSWRGSPARKSLPHLSMVRATYS
jgi:hypothetical protein